MLKRKNQGFVWNHAGSLIPPPHTGGWIEGTMKPVSLLIWISNLAQPCLLSAPQHHLPHMFESQLFKLTAWALILCQALLCPGQIFQWCLWLILWPCPVLINSILSYGWVSYILTRKEERQKPTLLKEAPEAERQVKKEKKWLFQKKCKATKSIPKYQKIRSKGKKQWARTKWKKGEVSLPIDFHWWTMATLQDWFKFHNDPMLTFFVCPIQSGILSLIKVKQTVETEPKTLNNSSS